MEGLDNIFRDQLQIASHEFFWGVLISAFAVAVGVFMEGPEIFHELWPRLFAWFTWQSREKHETFVRRIKKIAFIGWLLIGLGVFGEGVFEALQNRAEGQLQTLNNILLKDARYSATTAKKSAESAVRALDEVERRSDLLNKQLDAASVKMNDLDSRIGSQGPRSKLLTKAMPELVKELRPFARRQRVRVFVCGRPGQQDEETFNTAVSMERILGADGANWKLEYGNIPIQAGLWFVPNGCAGRNPLGGGLNGGVGPSINATASKATREAAVALYKGLAKALPFPIDKGAKWDNNPDFIKSMVKRGYMAGDDPMAIVANDPELIAVIVGAHP